RRWDKCGLYDGTSFREARLQELIDARGWDWPRTEHGSLKKKNETFAKQARRYPELKKLVKLRDQIAELRISKLTNTVGADSYSRCPRLPFWPGTPPINPPALSKKFLP